MLYIHQHTCISPQQTFTTTNIETLKESVDNKLRAFEPAYENIPQAILRRMGKAVRMGVGAALPILKDNATINGIIIGTANGGMEDCIKFLNQIIDYDEGLLTPGNFVQSTPNAIAAQVGLITKNKSYNNTHVHRGLAFETALIDAMMMVKENAGNNYLLGAVDEISSYNFNIDYLGGWYKKEIISNRDLFKSQSPASLAGEGAAMFLVNDQSKGACAVVKSVKTLHTEDEELVKQELKNFITSNFSGNQKPDILLTGENGDSRLLNYYTACESLFPETCILRYKYLCGEYPTTSAFAFWLSCQLLSGLPPASHMVKNRPFTSIPKTLFFYNNYKGKQHVLAILQNAG